MQITNDQSGAGLKITGALDISIAEDLQQALRGLLERGSNLRLDLSEIENCDTTALQLLHSAYRSATQQSGSLEFIGLSDVIVETAKMLGFPLPGVTAEGDESAITSEVSTRGQ